MKNWIALIVWIALHLAALNHPPFKCTLRFANMVCVVTALHVMAIYRLWQAFLWVKEEHCKEIIG